MVAARLATLTEIRTSWSIDDLASAHDFLGIKADAERAAMAKTRGRR